MGKYIFFANSIIWKFHRFFSMENINSRENALIKCSSSTFKLYVYIWNEKKQFPQTKNKALWKMKLIFTLLRGNSFPVRLYSHKAKTINIIIDVWLGLIASLWVASQATNKTFVSPERFPAHLRYTKIIPLFNYYMA